MSTHKFAVGQAVRFTPDWHQTRPKDKSEAFTITRLLPEEGNACQYRVKSRMDGHERVVREDQLARSV